MPARAILAALLLLGLAGRAGAGRAPATQPALPPLPLSVAIAVDSKGKPVATATWVRAQAETASRILGAAGVRLSAPRTRELPARHAALETRRDRDALGALVRRDAISVFVVASLRDVDDPKHYRLGVCWRPGRTRRPFAPSPTPPGAHKAPVRPSGSPTPGAHPRRYSKVRLIILTPDALATTLAHELGHYLGNAHTRLHGNLMSYRRTGGDASLTPAQVRQLRAEARRLLNEVSAGAAR